MDYQYVKRKTEIRFHTLKLAFEVFSDWGSFSKLSNQSTQISCDTLSKLIKVPAMETPVKWIATAKRLYNEGDGLERKQQAYLKQEGDTLRDLKNLNRERNDYTQGVKKKVGYFQGLLMKIHLRLNEAAANQQNNNAAIAANMDRQSREALQLLLESFESRLSSFKLTMRTEFDQLEAFEAELVDEIRQVDQLIEEIQNEESTSFKAVDEVNTRDREKMEQERKQRLEFDMQHKAAVGEIDREVCGRNY